MSGGWLIKLLTMGPENPKAGPSSSGESVYLACLMNKKEPSVVGDEVRKVDT